MSKNHQIVTRFAPSPTGLFHVGSYRTAIFSFLYARHNNGRFVLRIEDTDKERSKKECTDNILESLKWLGLDYDEMYFQSEKLERHEYFLKKMIEDGFAYEAEESSSGSGKAIRFKNPNKKVSFQDLIHGNIEFDTTELKDFVIAKNIKEPLFHLAVVVDDFESGITHVVRGDDHISNTPRQILIQEAIGAPTPEYAHLPLVLGEDRSKLSKRKGALALTQYREKGYLPEALLNYISLVGWNPGGEQEIFTEEELIKIFDLEQVHKGGAIFDEVKLKWVNKEHLKRVSDNEFRTEVEKRLGKKIDEKILEVLRERISYYGEIDEIKESGELDYLFDAPNYQKSLLIPNPKMLKDREMNASEISNILKRARDLIENIDEKSWNKENIKRALWEYATEEGRGAVLWPLRVALSGRERSTDPFTIAEIIGKSATIDRINDAI